MLNTRSNQKKQEIKNATEENLRNERVHPSQTPEQKISDVEKKKTESTTIPKTDEQEAKTIEFSPIGNGIEITGNTPDPRNSERLFTAEKRIYHGDVCNHGEDEPER